MEDRPRHRVLRPDHPTAIEGEGRVRGDALRVADARGDSAGSSVRKAWRRLPPRSTSASSRRRLLTVVGLKSHRFSGRSSLGTNTRTTSEVECRRINASEPFSTGQTLIIVP